MHEIQNEALTFHVVPPTGQSFHLLSEISQRLATKVGTDIYGPQRMDPNGPLTFPLVPP